MRKSAGILLYRQKDREPEVFLVHPGGPFWKNKETGAWSIPKGEFTGENPLEAAKREFQEETGQTVSGNFLELSPIRQKGGKMVFAWAVEGDADPDRIISNTFRQEWPYRSGKWETFPEVDKAAWFTLAEAMEKINPSQAGLIEELVSILQEE